MPSKRRETTADLLLGAGADTNIPYIDGKTLLGVAAERDTLPLYGYLQKKGAVNYYGILGPSLLAGYRASMRQS